MPSKRFAELDLERRERILAAATAEFSDRGYEASSVNRIIADARISKGSLYYYFDDKEDLFATVVEQASARMMEASGMPPAEELTADTFWNTFRDLTRWSMKYLDSNEWYVRLARSFHHSRLSAPDSPALTRLTEQRRTKLSGFLARGQALGVVRSDLPLELLVDAARAVDEAGGRWLLEHWDSSDPADRVTIADVHIDLMRDMLHAKNQGWED